MKSKILSLVLAICTFACGAEDVTDYSPELSEDGELVVSSYDTSTEYAPETSGTGSEGDELGQTSQAIYLPFNHGVMGNQGMCSGASWSGGYCMVPDKRDFVMRVQTGTCANSSVAAGLCLAAARWKSTLVGSGYRALFACGTSWPAPQWSGGSNLIDVKCGSAGGSLGQTTVPSIVDSHSAGPGSLDQFAQANVQVNNTSITQRAAWPGATAAQRENFSFNIALHEMFHASGRGHNGLTPGSTLMSAGGQQAENISANIWQIKMSLRSDEVQGMACYNPNSGTQPFDTAACPL